MYTVAFNLSQTILMKCAQCPDMYSIKTQVNNSSPLKQSSHRIRHNAIQICASSTSWGRISRISVERPRVFELETASIFEGIRNVTLKLSLERRQLTSIRSQGTCFLRMITKRWMSSSLHCFLAVLALLGLGFLACVKSASILMQC